MNRYLCVLLLISIFLSPGKDIALAKKNPPKPRIYLEKRVIAEMEGEQIKFFEVHRMERGDVLWKIFVDKLGGRQEEFEMFLEEFRKANPGIENPSIIKQGDKVKLPMTVGSLGRKSQLEELKVEGRIYEHTVVSGDVLWNIARKEFRTTSELIRYVDAVRKLNPFLLDPDRIYPRQRLYLPRQSYFAEDGDGEPEVTDLARGDLEKEGLIDEGDRTDARAVTAEGEGTGRGAEAHEGEEGGPLLDLPHKGSDKAVELERAYPEKLLEKDKERKEIEESAIVSSVVEKEGTLPDSQNTPIFYRGLIGDVLSSLGEKLIQSGEMYVPLDGGGELLLNMENYPIVRFSEGGSLILDLGGTIPEEVQKVINKKWQGYGIMTLKGDEEIESFIETLLQRANYHSVKEGDSTQLVIGENVSLTLESDLIVLKDRDSLLKGEVFAVKRSHSSSIPEHLSNVYAYCIRTGIVVIPYFVDRSIRDGYVISYGAGAGDILTEREKIPLPANEGVKYLLDILGIPFEEFHKISIKGPDGAFTLTIKADLVFWVGTQPYVLDPERFTEPITALLKKEGYRIVRVGKTQSYGEIIPEILKLSEKRYALYENRIIAGGEHQGYTLRASGIVLDKEETGGESTFIFIDGEVDTGMRELFSRHFGMRIVSY